SAAEKVGNWPIGLKRVDLFGTAVWTKQAIPNPALGPYARVLRRALVSGLRFVKFQFHCRSICPLSEMQLGVAYSELSAKVEHGTLFASDNDTLVTAPDLIATDYPID